MEITSFGLGVTSSETSPEVLGGKGAGLVYLHNLGVNVPPGFILHTDLCAEYQTKPKTVLKAIAVAIKPWLAKLNKHFGYMPLLSVRSGARQSMPGMMDTILNVGLDENSAPAWVQRLGADCVGDSRRRLIEMFGSVVNGLNRTEFHDKSALACFDLYTRKTGLPFPNAGTQLIQSIEAVLKSWNNERAKFYRKLNNIPDDWGTAVVVQAMVFGNLNDKSATGVLFTRNPDTGEDKVVGEFLPNAQGEDVVAGTRTPLQLVAMPEWNEDVAKELLATVQKLEEDRKFPQDVEFTIENGRLYILQTRNAKLTSQAHLKVLVDMHTEGKLNTNELFAKVKLTDFLNAQSDVVSPSFTAAPDFTGVPACSGVVTGTVVRSSAEAVAFNGPGKCILVTEETTPDDIAGMHAAIGVLTMTGGATSHAAVVARAMNRSCVVGLGPQHYNSPVLAAGSIVSLDGATGRVWSGKVPVVEGANNPAVETLNKLMLSNVKVSGLISDKDPEKVLDLGTFYARHTQCWNLVNAAIAKHFQVILDTRSGLGEASKEYDEIFPSADESDLVLFLGEKLEASGQLGCVRFLSNCSMPGADFVPLAQVTSLEGLVNADGVFTLNMVVEPWMKKIFKWKYHFDQSTQISIGVVDDSSTCYVAMSQIAQSMLRG